jgi:ADP-ribosylglycohydrolase
MLSLAAGDSAGGEHEGGYASVTQQAIVLTYHLLTHGSVDRDRLVHDLSRLHGGERDPSVVRSPSPAFARWLESGSAGELVLDPEPSIEPAARVAPVGVWFRRDPAGIVEAALDTARLTHLDGPTAVAATAAAGAVAAACFAQNGRDLLMAVADMAERAAREVAAQELRFSRVDAVEDLVGRFRAAVARAGRGGTEADEEVGDDPLSRVVAAIVMASPVTAQPQETVAAAAAMGGSAMGALVGAVVGARVGVRAWPWAIPNETWFVAMGQRLVAGEVGLDELPVPYAVEQRITYAAGTRRI